MLAALHAGMGNKPKFRHCGVKRGHVTEIGGSGTMPAVRPGLEQVLLAALGPLPLGAAGAAAHELEAGGPAVFLACETRVA